MPDRVALVESRCPTFSWGSVPGARSYELVVYLLGEEAAATQPVVRLDFAGSVTGWTPSVDRCLERGVRYGWGIRAVGPEETSEWSVPSLFEVVAGPTEVDFAEALAVLQGYSSGAPTARLREAARAEPLATSRGAGEAEDPTSTLSRPEAAALQAPASVSLVTEGAVGVGVSVPLTDLHVVGSAPLAGILLAPDEPSANDSSELFLAEDDDGTYGIKLKYDGSQNELQIWGHENGVDHGPWLTIARDSGAGTANLDTSGTAAGLSCSNCLTATEIDLYREVSGQITVPVGEMTTLEESCDPGDHVVGGGVDWFFGCTRTYMLESYPSDDETWTVTVLNECPGGSTTLRMAVVCIRG